MVLDFVNEVNTELESDDDYSWELDLSAVGQENLDLDNAAFDDGVWYLDDNVELGTLSAWASDTISLDIENSIDDKV